MRVISGIRRGAKLITREGDEVRPTTDRVKESIFNLIQGFIPCDVVLDLFAGSGALGIEAVSRGASKCICVDFDKVSLDTVKKNYENLRLLESCELILSDACAYLKRCSDKFDIIFLDPPYNKGFITPVMALLNERNLLDDDGVIVIESDDEDDLPEFAGFEILKRKKYGRTIITLYVKKR